MLKRKNKNKNERKMSRLFIVGSFLILIGITVIGIKIGYNYYLNKQEENAVNDFLEIKHEEEIPEETPTNEVVEEKKEETPTYNYIAVLEIPKINLKRGLLPINDKNNNVNKNVEVLKNSDMPNVKNGFSMTLW